MPPPRRTARVVPPGAVEGGRVTLAGGARPFGLDPVEEVRVGGHPARVVAASSSRLVVLAPEGGDGGAVPVTVGGGREKVGQLRVGRLLADGLYQVDNPVYDGHGFLYATFSGSRGQRVPVSVFRVGPDGSRDPLVAGIVNATALAFDPDGRLCVTSRFDGCVYRVDDSGAPERIASDLGVACGLAFSPDGSCFVGDRTGTVFRVNAAGRVTPFATLPPSVAAFHLAAGLEEDLFVTGPTLSARDRVYRIDRRGEVEVYAEGFGRPQGMAVGEDGQVYLAEALAGASGIFRLQRGGRRELVVAGAGLVGVALRPGGGMAVASRERAWFFDRVPG